MAVGSLPLWLELWVAVALLSAGLRTCQSTLSKWLTDGSTGLELAWATATLGALFLAPFAAWQVVQEPVPLSVSVIVIAVVAGCIELAGFYAWLEALSVDDLSIVSPLRQTVPIFVVVLEPILLGVAFDPRIAIGALLAAVGAYIVLVDNTGFLAPLARVSGKGPQLALGSALLFAFASITAKFILGTVPSVVYAFYIFGWTSVRLSGLLWQREGTLPRTKLTDKRFIALGCLTALVSLTTFATLNLTPVVSQALVVFRASILFNVVIGGLLFKETELLPKFLGSLFIILGITLTVL